MVDPQLFKLQFRQYPPSESELLLTSVGQDGGGNNFVVLSIRLPKMEDFASEPAVLTNMDRMMLHISGTGRTEHKFNGQTQQAKSFPGSIYILPKGDSSAWRLDHPSTTLHFYFFPSLLASITSGIYGASSTGLQLRYLFNGRDLLIEQIGRSILSELQTRGIWGRLYLESLIQTLIIHLIRNYSSIPSSFSISPPMLTPHQLQQVQAYIQHKLGDDPTLADMASSVGLSSCYFSRLFKQATGLSPHQYLIRSRVERAKALLLEGGRTIAETAREVGFADQSHLTRHFQRAFGVSPGTLAQNSKNVQKESKVIQDSRG